METHLLTAAIGLLVTVVGYLLKRSIDAIDSRMQDLEQTLDLHMKDDQRSLLEIAIHNARQTEAITNLCDKVDELKERKR